MTLYLRAQGVSCCQNGGICKDRTRVSLSGRSPEIHRHTIRFIEYSYYKVVVDSHGKYLPMTFRNVSRVRDCSGLVLRDMCYGTKWRQNTKLYSYSHIEGILPKGPYLPCVSMAGRALLAGYPRYLGMLCKKNRNNWQALMCSMQVLVVFKYSMRRIRRCAKHIHLSMIQIF